MISHFVYFVERADGCIKIGVTRNMERRLNELRTGSNKELKVVAKFPFSSKLQAYEMEKQLHKRFAKFRQEGEWFNKGLFAYFMDKALAKKSMFKLLLQNTMYDAIDKDVLYKRGYIEHSPKSKSYRDDLVKKRQKITNKKAKQAMKQTRAKEISTSDETLNLVVEHYSK